MRRHEEPHNTFEQVGDYLSSALGMVEALDPPSDLRETCFARAVDLLAAKQIVFEQPQAVSIPVQVDAAGRPNWGNSG